MINNNKLYFSGFEMMVVSILLKKIEMVKSKSNNAGWWQTI